MQCRRIVGVVAELGTLPDDVCAHRVRTAYAHGRAPGRCVRIVRMRRREYCPTEGSALWAEAGAGPSPDLAVDLSRESGRGKDYWIVL